MNETLLNQANKIADTFNIDGLNFTHDVRFYNDDNDMYVSLYYDKDKNLTINDSNRIFLQGVNKFLIIGYMFYGIREYQDNHEICLGYRKEL